MTEVPWFPTGRLRFLTGSVEGGYLLQQEWTRGERTEDGEPVTQWRIIPAVRGNNLTPDERGIVMQADLPGD
jgi:hypothetical protein